MSSLLPGRIAVAHCPAFAALDGQVRPEEIRCSARFSIISQNRTRGAGVQHPSCGRFSMAPNQRMCYSGCFFASAVDTYGIPDSGV